MATFEKYEWLNNAPDWIIENLRARVAAIKQPGDAAAFAKLRGASGLEARPVRGKSAQRKRDDRNTKPACSGDG